METTIFGSDDPGYAPGSIIQTYPDSCAIKSQSLILETFGHNISEDQLREEATELHWYTPGYGTPAEDMGKLLELHGVSVATFDHANQFTLMHELAQGHQVMVALDSNELWNPGLREHLLDTLGLSGANHALIVTGVDTTDADNLQVIVTDPGTGNVTHYPYEQFADAWQDSDFKMIATTEAPHEAASLVNFDFDSGILDTIMGMDTADWMNQFGELLHAGIDLGGDVLDYLNAHPELVATAVEVVPTLLADYGGTADLNLPPDLSNC